MYMPLYLSKKHSTVEDVPTVCMKYDLVLSSVQKADKSQDKRGSRRRGCRGHVVRRIHSISISARPLSGDAERLRMNLARHAAWAQACARFSYFCEILIERAVLGRLPYRSFIDFMESGTNDDENSCRIGRGYMDAGACGLRPFLFDGRL